MVDAFVEEIDDEFGRGLYPLPVEDVWTADDLRLKMTEALLLSPRITDAQKVHTALNILERRKYDLVKAVWEGSMNFHLARIRVLFERPRLTETTIKLVELSMVKPTLEVIEKIPTVKELVEKTGLEEKDIDMLVIDGIVERIANRVSLTEKGLKLLQGWSI